MLTIHPIIIELFIAIIFIRTQISLIVLCSMNLKLEVSKLNAHSLKYNNLIIPLILQLMNQFAASIIIFYSILVRLLLKSTIHFIYIAFLIILPFYPYLVVIHSK